MKLTYVFGVLRRFLLLLIAMCCVASFVLMMLVADFGGTERSLWKRDDASRDAYVIVAAYYDDRPSAGNPCIRVLGYYVRGYARGRQPVYCRVRFADGRSACLPRPATVAAFDQMASHGNSSLAAYLCHLAHAQRPLALTIGTAPRCGADGVELANALVTAPPADVGPGFGVCLSNIAHFRSAGQDAQALVEFVEMNTLLGMRVLYMYAHDMHADARAHVRWYAARGRVVVVDWSAHALALGEPEATTLALNDCLYRRMRAHAHLVFSDLNQLLAPKVHSSWRHLLADLRAQHNSSRVGVYLFRTFRYFDETGARARHRPNETSAVSGGARPAASYRLPLIVTHRVRERLPLGTSRHSAVGGAFVVQPTAVLGVTSSRAPRMLPGRRFYSVPPQLGCVHVYPAAVGLSARELVTAFLDPSLDKFVPPLLKAMHERFYTPRRTRQPL